MSASVNPFAVMLLWAGHVVAEQTQTLKSTG